MIDRPQDIKILLKNLRNHRVVGIIGARQVGKSTLSRMILKHTGKDSTIFDLENPEDISRLADPMLALKSLKGIVIIDEIQRYPEIFQVLRVLADRQGSATRYLVLGSASPELLRQSSETLAGRIVYQELGGFSLTDVGIKNYIRLWLRGGFPRSYLANTNQISYEWRQNFIKTFLERDIAQMGITTVS
ncbi:MAG: AAA family ATPase, partial [Thermodesulfovibrionales bacterium]|nr:AAA family ATPase [Thermodesulfovibrionales bacterium]